MKTALAHALLPLCLIAALVQTVPAQTEVSGSFVYGGQSSTALLPSWPRAANSHVSPEGRQVVETTWREPGGGLVATWRVEHIGDQNAVEYRWIFENKGTQPAKALTDVAALDLTLPSASKLQLVKSTGGQSGPFDGKLPPFIVSTSNLIYASNPAKPTALSAEGGRSSNKDMPFWVIHNSAANGGKYMGVGWSGQWQADFQPVAGQDAVRLTIGMPGTNIALPAGERIVSPGILVGDYQGDSRAGCNALRRIIYDQYIPLLGDKKAPPPVSWNSWFVFDNRINETMLKGQADAAAGLGLEYFCIDAGWFDGGFEAGVGNWTVDVSKFPKGLAPIGDYVAQKGMKLGLWFEPDRSLPGTRVVKEHPEWVQNSHVKLEIPEARQWIFEMMCKHIGEGNVQWIRYDYNHDPLGEWNARDTAETKGLTQIRYLLGEYELLDRLRRKFPNLLIESCASGGRRIDLETIRRAHTYWKNDIIGLEYMRPQATGANYFLPGVLLNANVPAAAQATSFDLHSLFGGPLGFATDWTKLDAAARERVRKEIADYKTVRHLINKDYYPLFPQSLESCYWVGWEFFDPSAGEGFFVVLRPGESNYTTASIRLSGVADGKTYNLSRLDGSNARKLSGKELLSSLTISLGPNGSEALRFKEVP